MLNYHDVHTFVSTKKETNKQSKVNEMRKTQNNHTYHSHSRYCILTPFSYHNIPGWTNPLGYNPDDGTNDSTCASFSVGEITRCPSNSSSLIYSAN